MNRRVRNWSAARLLGRRLRTHPAASAVLGLLLLVTLVVAAAVPRLVEQQTANELDYQLRIIGPAARSLQGAAGFTPQWPPTRAPDVEEIYGPLNHSFDFARGSLPEPLKSAVGAGQWIVQTPILNPALVNGSAASLGVQLTTDDDYLSRIRIVAGAAPAVWSSNEVGPPGAEDPPPVDVLLSTAAAREMDLAVGDLISLNETPGAPAHLLRVSGLYEPKDRGADYWTQFPSLLPATQVIPALAPPYLSAAAFVDPVTVGRLALTFSSARLSVYYPVSVDALEGADAETLRRQLAGAVSLGVSLPNGSGRLSVGTRADDAIETATERSAGLTGLIALLVSAPLGVLVAVLYLGVQSVVRSRREDLLLASARGASALQLRLVVGLEGAMLSVPAAILVTAVIALLLPGPPHPTALLLTGLVALAPPLLSAILAETRGDARRTPAASGLRGIAEIAVLLLTVVSLVLLARRGLAEANAAVGVDPVLSAAPLLLSVSIGILVLRGYPRPMRAAARLARHRSGLPAFVGSLRATRTPTLGLAGVLAVVVGLSVALFGGVMMSTFDRGIEQAAREQVGADARIDAPRLTSAEREAVGRVSGVRDVAALQLVGPLTLQSAEAHASTTVVLGQTQALGTLIPLPVGLGVEVDGRIPVVVSDDLLDALDGETSAAIGGRLVEIVGSLPAESRLGPSRSWLLIDEAFATRLTTSFLPDVLLVRADPAMLPGMEEPLRAAVHADSADPSALAAGPRATVTTVPAESALRMAEPAILGVRVGLLLAASLSVLLSAITLVLSTVEAAQVRARVAGILRTLGMPRRSLRALVAWELVPVAVFGLVAGSLLGIGLPYIVTAAVDLRAFTGGLERPTPVLEPLTLGIVLAVFTVVVLLSGILAIFVGNRIAPSATLKMGAS